MNSIPIDANTAEWLRAIDQQINVLNDRKTLICQTYLNSKSAEGEYVLTANPDYVLVKKQEAVNA